MSSSSERSEPAASGRRRVPGGGNYLSRSDDSLRRFPPSRTSSWPPRNTRSILDGPIIIGICAMEKKAKSQPMMEILDRITAFHMDGRVEFQVVNFAEEVILKEPVEKWPLCEALVAFHSTGFPLRKAQAYASLRRPHVFNNLEKQEVRLQALDPARRGKPQRAVPHAVCRGCSLCLLARMCLCRRRLGV